MARHDRNIQDGAAGPLSIDELLQLLDAADRPRSHDRQDAVACYLSGADGWRDAVKRLGGAFADPGSGLRERKPD